MKTKAFLALPRTRRVHPGNIWGEYVHKLFVLSPSLPPTTGLLFTPRTLFGVRPRSRGKGVIGGGGGPHTFVWVGEQWLATWLSEERVVEAVLGESGQDTEVAGPTAAANNGQGSQGLGRRRRRTTSEKNVSLSSRLECSLTYEVVRG